MVLPIVPHRGHLLTRAFRGPLFLPFLFGKLSHPILQVFRELVPIHVVSPLIRTARFRRTALCCVAFAISCRPLWYFIFALMLLDIRSPRVLLVLRDLLPNISNYLSPRLSASAILLLRCPVVFMASSSLFRLPSE